MHSNSAISIISAPGHFREISSTLGLHGIMGHAAAKISWITNDCWRNKSAKKDTMQMHGNGAIILLIGVGGFKVSVQGFKFGGYVSSGDSDATAVTLWHLKNASLCEFWHSRRQLFWSLVFVHLTRLNHLYGGGGCQPLMMKQEPLAVSVCHLSPASRVWSPNSDDRRPLFGSFGASFPSLHILIFSLIAFYERINQTSPDTRSCLVWSLGAARLKKIYIQSPCPASSSLLLGSGVYLSGSSQLRCSKCYTNCRPELNRIFGKGEMGHCACQTTVEEGIKDKITTTLATCSTGIIRCHCHFWQFSHGSIYITYLLGHQELGERSTPRHPITLLPHPRA